MNTEVLKQAARENADFKRRVAQRTPDNAVTSIIQQGMQLYAQQRIAQLLPQAEPGISTVIDKEALIPDIHEGIARNPEAFKLGAFLISRERELRQLLESGRREGSIRAEYTLVAGLMNEAVMADALHDVSLERGVRYSAAMYAFVLLSDLQTNTADQENRRQKVEQLRGVLKELAPETMGKAALELEASK